MGTSRRDLIRAALLAPATMVPVAATAKAWAEQYESLFNLGSTALVSLANKVMPEVALTVRNTALAAVAKQIQMTDESTISDTTWPLLHADDLAHGRIVSVHGLTFSQTQIGILALLTTPPGEST